MAGPKTYNVAGCFGVADRHFAGHPADETRAFELLGELRKNSVAYPEARKLCASFLKSQNVTAAHLKKELAKVEKYFKPWL